ncbi:MAG: tetratricopeptide repeat protein [Chloroflexi bacterium]|nr:tetratricopeptide repeat protein [Chloroflexota bacterium]
MKFRFRLTPFSIILLILLYFCLPSGCSSNKVEPAIIEPAGQDTDKNISELKIQIDRLLSDGKIEDAKRLAENTVSLSERLPGDNSARSRIRTEIGMIFEKYGHTSEAAEYSPSDEIFSKKDSAQKAVLLQKLGFSAQEAGNYKLAEKALTEALRILSSHGGNNAAGEAVALSDLARVQISAGEFRKAEKTARKSAVLAESLNNFPRADLANIKVSLGEAMFETGDYDEAEKNYREAEALLKNEDNPDAEAVLRNNLGTLLRAKGDLEGAASEAERSLAVLKRLRGENHPSVGVVLINLASTMKDAGNLDGASKNLDQARKILEENRMLDSPAYASYLQQKSSLLYSFGKYSESEKLALKALEIQKSKLGESHPEAATTYNQLASAAMSLGKLEEAYNFAGKALEIDMKALGRNHPETARDFADMAKAAMLKGDTKGAGRLVEKALKIKTRPGIKARHIALKAEILEAKGDPDEAADLYKKALSFAETALGKDHPDLIFILEKYSDLIKRSDIKGAEEMLKRASDIGRKMPGLSNPQVQITRNSLARLLLSEKKAGEAEKLLAPYVKNPAASEVQVFTWEILMEAEILKGNKAGAEAYCTKALELARRIYPPDDPRLEALENKAYSVKAGKFD